MVTYHFRIAATNDYGLVYGSDQSFTTAQGTTIDLVAVGDPGNSAYNVELQPWAPEPVGAVAYPYYMGKYEVTAAQYTDFLNTVASTDTYGLYSILMADPSNLGCNIQRSGAPGSYTYSVGPDWAERPVSMVSFWNAARFANWLENGQPWGLQVAATTEDGVYALNGYTGTGGGNISRRPGSHWCIPSADEWFKAGFYKGGGRNAGYWGCPTQSDTYPIGELPPGHTEPPGSANYEVGPGLLDPVYHTTKVGAYIYSPSPYGTYDQGGNVSEWLESVYLGSYRGYVGGDFGSGGGNVGLSLGANRPDASGYLGGFRVAYIAGQGLSVVSTLSATGVSTTNATLNGTVKPNGWPTTAWFQWGATTNYGNLTSVTDLGSGTNALPLSAPLAGLIPNTTYHFQAMASDSSGVSYGSDQSFTTWGLLQVSTLSATAVTRTTATLNGTIDPDGWPTTAWFQWGTTTAYGNFTPVTGMGSGTTALALSVPLAGLTPGTIYHFRAAATNIAGVVYGSDQSFITTVPTFTDAKWVSLGFELDGNVNALAMSGTNLYAGGFFATAGGVTVNGIVKWDGSAWWALGSGMSRAFACSVDALALSGTNLYASGFFGTAGGVPANNIAKWNGGVWSALGSGLDGRVYALAVMGTDLYAGGGFITAGGMSANNVAKWDGHTWSALGSGLGGGAYYANVRALAVSGTNLYAGGFFTTAGGVSANYIAKWDGRAWSALGAGMSGSFLNPQVAALAVSGTDLYAGGDFTTEGGVTGNGIAKWDGSAWSALGPGMNSTVYALAMDGTDLYAGGQFTTAGGLSAANIAKWDGSAWSALGSGLSTSVYALAADGRGHLFVGGAFIRAGTNACLYLAQANLGSPPAVLIAPQTQTAETGAAVNLGVDATGDPPPFYQWYLNGTNLLSCTSSNLVLTNILFSQSGTYRVVLTNRYGAVTSAPVMLDVIPTVERRPVPGLQLMGDAGASLNLDAANPLSFTPHWLPLDTVTLESAPQYYFDLTVPLPPQRFYRAWQSGAPGVRPSLDLQMVPAITLTGSIGHSVRVDYINHFGPTDAWVTLATVTLTNTSQLYFDTSAWRQPPRLYRLVPSP